jgi:UDP-glucose 4-epimerase
MASYLVSGATGFIGSRLVKMLVSQNHKVTLLSRKAISQFDSILFDLESDDFSQINLENIDVIFHLAGIAHENNNSQISKKKYQKINVDSVIKLAEFAVNSEVKKFIFVSTVKAGGTPTAATLNTENDQNPLEGIYAKSKREAELKLIKLGKSTNMFISIVRPALVYGPEVKGNLELMLRAIERGWFPPLPKINNNRSMIHVDDLVEALYLVSNNIRANGEIFIATDGKSYSSHEIYQEMCFLLNKSVPKWTVPHLVFKLIALFHPSLKQKVNKLLGDESYSSEKIESIGFKPKRTLREMNETSF